ncbi:hypothetical protein APR04_000544 [Promicromonospora umidemergens]|uniref:hypothetical protein n=1 Tax=Promicromonospora umidemergens TaxID=629679 RepID=UPI0020A2D6D9|nr:hypothetical protein [Promicromonospora umidemergens]MCP2281655.1 hypothetical protein [Promicromonospora umidemergens]
MAADGWTWTVDEPEGWVLVPTADAVPPELLEVWEREITEVVRVSFDEGPVQTTDAETIEALDALRERMAVESVANLRAFAEGVVDAGALVAATFRVPDSAPVPVLVTVGVEPLGDPGDHLMTALGATGGNPVAPPKIEHVDLPDGDGMRVTRLDLDPETGGAWVSVCLGRRTEHADAVVDTVLQWRSQDVLQGPAMTELLDELLPVVSIVRSTS